MARTETAFGYYRALGTSYVQIGSDTTNTHNLHINVTNRTTSAAKLRLYAAASSWTTGEPTASDEPALAYDMQVGPGEVVQIAGIVLASSKALIARSDTASSLDLIVSSVSIT